MRAILDRDIIVHVTPHGDTEIGSIPSKQNITERI